LLQKKKAQVYILLLLWSMITSWLTCLPPSAIYNCDRNFVTWLQCKIFIVFTWGRISFNRILLGQTQGFGFGLSYIFCFTTQESRPLQTLLAYPLLLLALERTIAQLVLHARKKMIWKIKMIYQWTNQLVREAGIRPLHYVVQDPPS
jgi:hypothetical protein